MVDYHEVEAMFKPQIDLRAKFRCRTSCHYKAIALLATVTLKYRPSTDLLLPERCHTDDLLPSVPIFGLPPCSVSCEILGLDVLISVSQPAGSWASGREAVKRRYLFLQPVFVGACRKLPRRGSKLNRDGKQVLMHILSLRNASGA